MKFRKPDHFLICPLVIVILCLETCTAQRVPAHKTQNVILVMIDGMRWQEIFRGADSDLIRTVGPDWLGAEKERTAEAQREFWRETQAERREALMPFFWTTIAKEGQLFGNRDLGSDAHV